MTKKVADEPSLTFSQWWDTFDKSLKTLSFLVEDNQTVAWQVAKALIPLGKKIEQNALLNGLSCQAKMQQLEKRLGQKITINATFSAYVPKIDSIDSYLFAINYYKHLCRFQHIESSSCYVQDGVAGHSGIKDLKPNYLLLTQQFKKMLLAYEKANHNLLKKHKRLNTMSGESYFTKSLALVNAPDIATQISDILMNKCYLAINESTRKSPNDIALLITQIQKTMSMSRKQLNEITSLRLLMALIEENDKTTKSYIRHPKVESNQEAAKILIENLNYASDTFETWHKVAVDTPKRDALSKKFVQGIRAAGHISDAVTTKAGFDTQKGVLQFCPDDNTDYQSLNCYERCKTLINEKAKAWSNNFSELDTDLLINTPATELKVVCEKIAFLQYMINMQHTLAAFNHQNDKGWVYFSKAIGLSWLTRLLSHSFLNVFLSNRMLLVYAAEELNDELSKLIENVNSISSSLRDINDRQKDCLDKIECFQNKAEKLNQRLKFPFFGKSFSQSYESYQEISEMDNGYLASLKAQKRHPSYTPEEESFNAFSQKTSLLDNDSSDSDSDDSYVSLTS